MDEIKIFFIIIGTFFMREQPGLIAENATVFVDPLKKEVRIEQQNLISTTAVQEIEKTEEFLKLKKHELAWSDELEVFKNKQISFQENNGKISSTITFNYDRPEDLSKINLHYSDSEFSILQEENMEAKSGKSEKKEPYLIFSDSTPFSFSVTVYDEWLDPQKEGVYFNPEYIDQPLVMKKSDALKGRTYHQTSQLAIEGIKPLYSSPKLNIFFAEDQDFALLNEEYETEVEYLDNNVVNIKIKDMISDMETLKVGDNYFKYVIDGLKGTLILISTHEQETVDAAPKKFYFSMFSEKDF